MLEEHVVPWLKEWHLSFGMMGVESIHAYFNRLGKMYDVMPDRLQRLKHKMKEHLLHVAPANVDAKPIKKKGKWTLLKSQPQLLFISITAYTCLPSPMSILSSPYAPKSPNFHSQTLTPKLSVHELKVHHPHFGTV